MLKVKHKTRYAPLKIIQNCCQSHGGAPAKDGGLVAVAKGLRTVEFTLELLVHGLDLGEGHGAGDQDDGVGEG